MQRKHPESQSPISVLIAGIPIPALISHIGDRYGKGVKLFVSESRPFEQEVARAVADAKDAKYKITLCTDNMIGSLMNEYGIDAVWSLYSKKEEDVFTAINGARLSAILAKEHKIPFMLYPHSSFPPVGKGSFAGESVTVESADYIEHELDRVRADLVAEAV
jgi:methylthioribose-1-phosphate isomerase